MKNLKNRSLLLAVVFFFFSCQDVIELELENVAPRLVVEANISDQAGPYTVTLTQTGDFYKNNTFLPRTGAVVVISDDFGSREILTEINPGVYQTSSIQGVKGLTYTLEINSEGENYIASSKIPNQVAPLDSVSTFFEEGSIFNDEGYYAKAFFQDIPNVSNYYRFKVFVNGEIYVFNADNADEDNFEDDNLYLSQDKFFDGKYTDEEFPQKLNIGDSVKVEMYHINKASFDYYRTLGDAIGTAGVAPANPISNFGKTALGNFNAYVYESKTVEVKN